MLAKLNFCFTLLSVTAAMAATQDFRLGVNYAELIPAGSLTTVYQAVTATDAQGAIYIWVSGATTSATTEDSYLIKLRGNQIVYRNMLPFIAVAMAVDPAGNVYLITSPSAGSYAVVKLGTDGATVEYNMGTAPNVTLTGLAVDSAGRAYVAGFVVGASLPITPGAYQQTPPSADGSNAFVMRLKPSGAIDYATYLGGSSQASSLGIAVDAEGSAFVTGNAYSADFPTTPGAYLAASGIPNFNYAPFLVRLSADGSALIYSTFTSVSEYTAYYVAVDSADNAVIVLTTPFGAVASVVERFNPQGTAIGFSRLLPASSANGLAVDAAGNTYVSLTANANFAAVNSLAPCQTAASGALAVLDGNGNILQATYIPGAFGPFGFALGVNSTINVVGAPAASYAATQQFEGSSGGPLFLTSLSQDTSAPIVQLACFANAASYDGAAISAGEIVSLFGQGLGPGAGTQPQAAANGFPKQLAGVQVTFNGTPGPLLYVQNGQINAISPWALQGSAADVCVVYNGSPTNCVTRPVANQHPGVFTLDGVYAAAVNQDGSLNTASNPAQVGSTVSIFATGMGPIDPPQPDGAILGLPLPSNVLQASVYWLQDTFFIGTIAVSTAVSYGGPAPFAVAGFSQVDFVVANTDTPYGGQAPFILQTGPQMSMGAIIVPGSNGFLVHVVGE